MINVREMQKYSKFLIFFRTRNEPLEADKWSITQNIAVIMNQKLGLKEIYPQVLCIAAVLPMSTAEVERIFSQIKLIKNDQGIELTRKPYKIFSTLS